MGNGRPKGVMSATHHRYTHEQRAYLREVVPGHSHVDIARLVNKRFGIDLCTGQIAAYIKNNGLNTGLTGRFGKGHVPANKGTKGMSTRNRTTFSKGNVSANRVPLGTETVREDGYVWVKIADGLKNANWIQKHIIAWEEANGPLPSGHVLIFANGDPTDVRLDNLVVAERADLAVMNKRGLRGHDAESAQAAVLVSKILRASRAISKGEQ